MSMSNQAIEKCIESSNNRIEFWVKFINANRISSVVEVGVFKGDFSKQLLQNCDSINQYYMLDPWRHLEDWNKPANENNAIFEQYLSEAISKTDFAAQNKDNFAW